MFEGRERRRVKSRAEYEALPGAEGAWWRDYFARGDTAWDKWLTEFPDEETAALEWDRAMLSVFPQSITHQERIDLFGGRYCIRDDEDKDTKH